MSTNTLSLISTEKANDAYFDGLRKAKKLRELAQAIRKIAGALGGAYITKRLDDKLAKMFPGVHIGIHKTGYSARKYVYYHERGAANYSEDWNIMLHEGEDNRVNASEMMRDADKTEAEAAALEDKLTRLHANVCQYNALATAYAAMFDDLHELIEGMVWADWSFHK